MSDFDNSIFQNKTPHQRIATDKQKIVIWCLVFCVDRDPWTHSLIRCMRKPLALETNWMGGGNLSSAYALSSKAGDGIH